MISEALIPRLRCGRILFIFLKSSARLAMEYRGAFFANLVLSAFWLLWATQTTRVYFIYTKALVGWTYQDMLILLGVFFTMNGLRQTFLSPNLRHMVQYVRNGDLDYLLTKPVDTQFIVSFRYIDIHHLPDPLVGIGLTVFGYVYYQPGRGGLTLGSIIISALVFWCGFIILYSLSFMLQVLALFSVRSDGLEQIMNGILDMARMPVSVYGSSLQAVLTMVVPVSFVITVPSETLTGKASYHAATLAAIVALCSLAIARISWLIALRRYNGVGSLSSHESSQPQIWVSESVPLSR